MRADAATKKAALAAVVAASLSLGSAVAQPSGQRLVPPGSGAQPGTDAEIVVKPPATGDSRLARPAPPSKDTGLVEKPPAEANPGPGNGRSHRNAPPPKSPKSRQGDCKGTAGDCKQSSPR